MEAENVVTKTSKKSPFTEEQRRGIVDEYNAGTPVPELQSKYGINSNSTIYMWKKVFEGRVTRPKKKPKPIKRRKVAVNPTLVEKPSYNGDLAAENQTLRNLLIDSLLGKLKKALML